MNQIYNNDPYVEVGFFYEMANLLNGVKRKEQFNFFPCYEVQCPNCGKSAARMGFFSRANTFAIQCPVNGCVLNKRKNRKGLTIHDLIKHYGGDEMFDRWCKETGRMNYRKTWYPIKNRRDGEKKTRNEKTFREKMDIKSTRLMINARAGKFS